MKSFPLKKSTKSERSSLAGSTSMHGAFRGFTLAWGALAPTLLGCSLITHTSLDECEKTGDCGEIPLCDPTVENCALGSGGAPPTGIPGTGGGAPITGGGDATGGSAVNDMDDPGVGGTLGMPQCDPQTEICNGKDDDCNGSVDEGCPSGFEWKEQVEEEAVGDGFGGSYFGVSCESDEIVVGLRIKSGSFIDGVGALCSRVVVEPTSENAPFEYGLVLEPATFISAHNDEGTTTDLKCNDGHALIGLRAALQNYNNGTTDFVVLTRTWIQCAPVFLDEATNAVVISSDESYEKGPVSGTYADNTAWFGEYVSGRIVSGIHGMGGSWIDRMGLKTAIGAVF